MKAKIYTLEIPLADLLRFFGAIVLILALALGVGTSARAQTVCMMHPDLANQLDSRFSEAPIAIGLASNNVVVEVFSNGDGSTWTMVLTKPDGMSCVMATGEDWETLNRLVLGPRS